LIASNSCDADTAYQQITIQEVGLPELKTENNIKLWPNPSSGKFKVTYSSNESADAVIFNSEGKKVFAKTALKSEEEINLAGYAKGIYFVQLRIGKKIENRKLLLE
jgi:hypothetical protein